MNPAFATRLPLKMFHRVAHVNLRSIDSSVRERAIHDFPSRTNEWFARHIFVIARLFANQHHRCALSVLPQKQFGSLACTNDMQCNELLLRAWWPDLMYPAAALVARIPCRSFPSPDYESQLAPRSYVGESHHCRD